LRGGIENDRNIIQNQAVTSFDEPIMSIVDGVEVSEGILKTSHISLVFVRHQVHHLIDIHPHCVAEHLKVRSTADHLAEERS
jgi:hypothetical protein